MSKEEERYYERLPKWPDFDVVDGNIDGLIPSTRIDSWADFQEVLKDERFNHIDTDYIWRGQQHYKYFLTPTLGRVTGDVVKEDVAERHFKHFKLSVRGRLSDSSVVYEKPEELWAIGQHHGLMTPLLDWTGSPYVALFFAFEKIDPDHWVDEKENHSRAIFILNKTFIEKLENEYLKIVEPAKDDHGRLVNQAGLFTLAPYDETLESSLINLLAKNGEDTDDPNNLARFICKVHIPNVGRDGCIQHLRKMNIHHSSLFPDVIGASLYCNEITSEYAVHSKETSEITAKEKDAAREMPESSLPFDAPGVDQIADAMDINDEARMSVSTEQIKGVAEFIVDYVLNHAEVDWWKRDSAKARLRILVRKKLIGITYSEAFLDQAVESAIMRAEELYGH